MKLCKVVMLMYAFVLLGTTVAAQPTPPTQFTFKGNYLGMSLQEFKTKNEGQSIFINTGPPDKHGSPQRQYTHEVPTPLCTDQYNGFDGDPGNEAPNEVLCNPSPANRNQSALQFAGVQALTIYYRFLYVRLYQIDIHLTSHDFADVKAAFVQRYGEAANLPPQQYQNGFGATWTGELCQWKSEHEVIALAEGSGNGPGQDSRSKASGAIAIFTDETKAPARPTKPADF